MIKKSISEIRDLCLRALLKANFSTEEIDAIIENILFAEMSNKKTHGLIRISYLIESVQLDKITTGPIAPKLVKDTQISMLIDGENRTGLYVINKSIELAIEKVKKSGMCILAVTNTAPMSGVIGQYAQTVVEKDLIMIAFNNSSGRLAPHGSIDRILGINPITVGIPSNTIPVILDMASSRTTFGNILLSKALGEEIPDNVAIDKDGNTTTSPVKAIEGALLPFEGHKGSGLGIIVELLAGALTNSRCGFNKLGGWGSLFILIDPNILIDLDEFKSNVDSLIDEIKNSRKMSGYKEIFMPGEQSHLNRIKAQQDGYLEVDEKILQQIENYLD
jgi:LDH2 family malate/lactate/ureidoglycolate dehydrogenase